MKRNNGLNAAKKQGSDLYATSILSLQKLFPECSVNKLIDAVRMAGPEQRDIVQYLETIRNAGVGKALREPSTARSSSSKAFYGLMQRP